MSKSQHVEHKNVEMYSTVCTQLNNLIYNFNFKETVQLDFRPPVFSL